MTTTGRLPGKLAEAALPTKTKVLPEGEVVAAAVAVLVELDEPVLVELDDGVPVSLPAPVELDEGATDE